MQDETLEEQEEYDGPLVYRVLTKEEVEEARREAKRFTQWMREQDEIEARQAKEPAQERQEQETETKQSQEPPLHPLDEIGHAARAYGLTREQALMWAERFEL